MGIKWTVSIRQIDLGFWKFLTSTIFFRNCQKLKQQNFLCIFCLILFLANHSKYFRSISLINTVLLIPILAYFMTLCVIWHLSWNVIKWQKMAFYDILWHVPYDIWCHKVCQFTYILGWFCPKQLGISLKLSISHTCHTCHKMS